MRGNWWVALGVWLGVQGVWAQTERVVKVYPLRTSDPDPVVSTVRALVEGEGHAVYDRTGNRLIVTGPTGMHSVVAAVLEDVDISPDNIRLDVEISDASATDRAGAQVTGGVTVETGPAGRHVGVSLSPAVERQSSQSAARTRQSLLVQGGRAASLIVGEELPYLDWLLAFGREHGYLRGSVTWRRVGAALQAEARVLADGRLSVRLTPELSGFSDGTRQSVSFIALATEVVVADGGTVTLGEFGRNQDFYDRFLVGYSRDRRTVRRAVTLTARRERAAGGDARR